MTTISGRISLRRAESDDAVPIAALLGELGHPVDAADVPERLARVLREGGEVLVAVADDGVPLGLISLARHAAIHTAGPVGYIMALVTADSARRRGVGKLLVEAAKDWAAREGCVRLSVTSAERRADAHAFYPACGMPYTGRRFATEIPAPARRVSEDER
ncbi:MAG: GNAT family N-acetyltransferase [Gemmatimonadaceae bacterium]